MKRFKVNSTALITNVRLVLVVFLCTIGSITAYAQLDNITGPAAVSVGQTATYTIVSSGEILFKTNVWNVPAQYGTVVATTTSADFKTATATITWKYPGAATITLTQGGGTIDTHAVTITCVQLAAPVNVTNDRLFSPGSLTLAVTVSGLTDYTIQWFTNAAGTGTPIATGATYTTPVISSTTLYYAKVINNTTTCVSAVATVKAEVIPVGYQLTDPLSIRQDVVRKAGVTLPEQIASLTDAERTTAITYFDGSNRVSQQIAMKGSPAGNDVVQPVEYDAQGRSVKSYLAYVPATQNGAYHVNYKSEQATFYVTAGDKVADDNAPYAITRFEDSPMARVAEQGAPGQAWQPGGGHTATAIYGFNTGATASEAEEVRQFSTDGSSAGFYAASMLNRMQATGEDGGTEISFTDSRGRTLAKKKRLDQTIAGQTVNYLQTYYIYDDFDRIQYIISPKGVAALKANSWSLTATIIDSYIYQFSYDARGRLIGKKVPGQAWLYYVYDPLDRVVLTQDGLLRASNKWFFIKYDQQDRPVLQGLYLNATQTTQAAVQGIADALYTSSNASYPENNWYEARSTTLHGYTNTSFPKTNADNTALEIFNVNFYDTYDFDDADTADDYAYVNQGIAGEATQGRSLGLPTGSKRVILGTTTWLYSYVFYDKYGRVIQTQSNNHLSAAIDNITTNVYDFEGKLLQSKTTHKGGTGKETTVTQRQEYDNAGRIKNIYRPIATPQPVQWANLANASAAGNTITKTTATTAWDAGGFSVNHLNAGQDGWVEYRANSVTTGRMIGFSDQDVNVNYNTIDYALYTSSVNAALVVYENGTSKGTFGTHTAGDFFAVERKNGVVYYKKNNQVFYTSTIPSTGVVYVDCSLYNANASAVDVKLFTTMETLVAQYEYNELGQLVDKKLHNTGGTNFLQSVDYRYNIRGWLSSINNAALDVNTATNDETNDYFGMEFLYNTVQSDLGNTAIFNGNISATKWKGPGTEVSGTSGQRSYRYTYDKASQLRAATYQANTGCAWTGEAGALNESMNYDHNGNITDLQRSQRKYNDATGTYTAQTIDNLTYTYNSTIGDQLQKVEDATAIAAGFNNGASAATEYTYDTNGNILTDQNKGISAITYNFLGKPTQITFTDGRKIQYVYDAAGNKLTMKTYAAGATNPNVTTDYVGAFVYENTNLSFYTAPEGRVVMNKSYPEYQYGITDHQGNTRILFTSATPQAETTTVDFESATNSNVQNYPSGAYRNSMNLYDHTDTGTASTYSQLLNGSNNGQVGIAKSFKIFPGDKVKIEAYAKYSNQQSTSADLTTFTAGLLAAFGAPAPVAGEAGTASAGLNSYGGLISSGNGPGDNDYPKAFVNIVIYDKDYNMIDFTYQQIDGGEQVGVSPSAPHDYMSAEYTAKEAGYAYVFISNENPTLTDVYFDDVTITRTPTNVIQYNEYYPFGLQAGTSWTRDETKNSYLYNAGSELNTTSGWYDLVFRNYDPALARFVQVDPKAIVTPDNTPFGYAGNNPVLFNDPFGDLTQGDIAAIVTGLMNLKHGGTWSSDGSGRAFTSDEDAALFVATFGAMFSGGGGSPALDAAIAKMNAAKGMTGSSGKWCSFCGNEISRQEWLDLGGDAIEEADHYYPGEFIFEAGQIQGSVVLDLNGNISSWGLEANIIYVDVNGTNIPFHDRLVRSGTMTAASFSKGLGNILNGMKLPKGTFDRSRLYNGKISIGLIDGTSYNGGVYTGKQATTRVAEDGSLVITYQHMNGPFLTVDGIRSLLGGHEYYAHGILGLIHPNDNAEIERIQSAYPY